MKPKARQARKPPPRAASEAEHVARLADPRVLSNEEKAKLAAEASRGEDA
jgi:hypothetical protein